MQEAGRALNEFCAMWMFAANWSGLKVTLSNRHRVQTGLLVLSAALVGNFMFGCCHSGVSYSDNGKCLIVRNSNAILSCKDTVIGDVSQVDTILLEKNSDNLVRVTYFNVSKDSTLSVSEDDFRLDCINGRISLCATTRIFAMTNQYDRCEGIDLNMAGNNRKKIVIDEVRDGRITYIGHRDAAHIIWIDAKQNDGQRVHIPLRINGHSEKRAIQLKVEKREKCDYVIQENLYEFGVL